MKQPLSNISGDLERIFDEMWQQLRDAMPHLRRNVQIMIGSWEYESHTGRDNDFQIWNNTDFIKVAELQERPSDASCQIPIKNWDKFIDALKVKYEKGDPREILFRKF